MACGGPVRQWKIIYCVVHTVCHGACSDAVVGGFVLVLLTILHVTNAVFLLRFSQFVVKLMV